MLKLFGSKKTVTAESLRDRTLLVGLGAMKCGTTWLSNYLSAHPDFYHSPVKEMNYFNRLYDNPFRNYGKEFRLYRIEEIILNGRYPLSAKDHKKLRTLAQLGRLRNHEEFLAYFAERIGEETHFGEISPANSHIPAAGLRDIAGITRDVRFIFLMRDPTNRAASNIQHVRRRLRANESIDNIIDTITPSNHIFLRSDYTITLDAIAEAGLASVSMILLYETLFCEETIRNLCDWLGLKYVKPDFEKRLNVARGESVTEEQKMRIRDRLDPIYRKMESRFPDGRPASWQW